MRAIYISLLAILIASPSLAGKGDNPTGSDTSAANQGPQHQADQEAYEGLGSFRGSVTSDRSKTSDAGIGNGNESGTAEIDDNDPGSSGISSANVNGSGDGTVSGN